MCCVDCLNPSGFNNSLPSGDSPTALRRRKRLFSRGREPLGGLLRLGSIDGLAGSTPCAARHQRPQILLGSHGFNPLSMGEAALLLPHLGAVSAAGEYAAYFRRPFPSFRSTSTHHSTTTKTDPFYIATVVTWAE
jgi:hypothetical protein